MYGKEAKYVVVMMRTGMDGTFEDQIVPFSSRIIHKKMAESYGRGKVVSAGFIRFSDDGPECYGQSISLGLDSRPEDTLLAKSAFGEDYR